MERCVGDNIRSFRLAKGLRQTDLGELCGMADSQIGTYERGETKPKAATLERIATALGITVEDLRRGTMEVQR
jgi:transcriptional regulator with XRE-family HTH domain